MGGAAMNAHHVITDICTLPRSAVSEDLHHFGMHILGALAPDETDNVPPCQNGQPTKTVLLIGNAGARMWNCFQTERQQESDPLDAWTRRSLTPIAQNHGFDVVFPFEGPPFLPFSHWGTKAGAFFVSPGVPNIHPIYGSWFGLRGAFLSPEDCRDLAPPPFTQSPCDTCYDQLCIEACPASALSEQNYDVVRCIEYTRASPGYPCIKNGCRARHACPIGQDYAYGQAQAEFHMRGFVGVLEKIKPKT